MAERETRTTNGGGGRGGLYALLTIIIVLIIVAIVLFMPRAGSNGTDDIDADVRIEAPEVDRNGAGNTGGGGSDGG